VILSSDSREINVGKKVQILKGAVSAEVVHQTEGRPMIFVTPQALATVLGTKLSLAVNQNATRLEVREGKVRLSDSANKARFADVEAGQFAVAALDHELIATPMTELLRVLDNHEGSMEWTLNPKALQPVDFAFATDSVYQGRQSLRITYEPKATGPWTFGQLYHPIELQGSDRALRLAIYLIEAHPGASWNIQFLTRDSTYWMIGGKMFNQLKTGWNIIELEFPKSPENVSNQKSVVYDPVNVKGLLFSICQQRASFYLDDLVLISEADNP
jgi:hypothetical protein